MEAGLLAHCLQISINGLLSGLHTTMHKANVQFPHIMPVEALAHLLPRELCEAHENSAAGLTV
jgi:hypothetical protein